MVKVNIKEKLQLITDHWKPIIVGDINNHQVKLVKVKGEFVMHKHDAEDEMFMVVKGQFDMEYEDRTETIDEGEFVIVPKGIKHKPVAKEEAHIMLFEPSTVLNTGDVQNELTHIPLKK
jgi:mannose-6-phosphate isomerase-like protein (cupin superfamily)